MKLEESQIFLCVGSATRYSETAGISTINRIGVACRKRRETYYI
jgi:hypothetical protein